MCLSLIDGACTSVALMKMSGPSTDVTVTPLPHVLFLVRLHSIPIQDEQVYQCRVRRTGHLISRSLLSDELAVEGAWLRGKMANFPMAFQLWIMTLCVCILEMSLFGTSSLAMQARTNAQSHTKVAKQLWVQGTLNQAENTCKGLK